MNALNDAGFTVSGSGGGWHVLGSFGAAFAK